MSYWDRKLKREQLDEKLKGLKESPIANVEFGWIKSIRQALGMSTFQLAKRAGLDQSRITRIENAEVNGDLNLSTLKKIAEVLNMRFVYAFVPEEGLEEMVRDQAEKIARERLEKVSHTMKLENQELTESDKSKALDDLVQKILIDEPKDFWDK
jgi:predicted DNA-binding mobile mystery protein A